MTRMHRSATLAAIGIALIALCAGYTTARVLDLHSTADFNHGINALYEDGSFIVSVGELSISGCLPMHTWNGSLTLSSCSGLQWIGIDTPWEDIAPEPVANVLYYLTGLIKANNGCPC